MKIGAVAKMCSVCMVSSLPSSCREVMHVPVLFVQIESQGCCDNIPIARQAVKVIPSRWVSKPAWLSHKPVILQN